MEVPGVGGPRGRRRGAGGAEGRWRGAGEAPQAPGQTAAWTALRNGRGQAAGPASCLPCLPCGRLSTPPSTPTLLLLHCCQEHPMHGKRGGGQRAPSHREAQRREEGRDEGGEDSRAAGKERAELLTGPQASLETPGAGQSAGAGRDGGHRPPLGHPAQLSSGSGQPGDKRVDTAIWKPGPTEPATDMSNLSLTQSPEEPVRPQRGLERRPWHCTPAAPGPLPSKSSLPTSSCPVEASSGHLASGQTPPWSPLCTTRGQRAWAWCPPPASLTAMGQLRPSLKTTAWSGPPSRHPLLETSPLPAL